MFPDDVGPYELKPLDPVALPLGAQALELREVLVAEGEDHGAAAPEREAKLLGPPAVQLASTRVDPCLARLRRRVVSRMDEAAVRLGGPAGDVVRGLNHRDGEVVARELTGDRAADDAASDDHDVVSVHVCLPSRMLTTLSYARPGAAANRVDEVSTSARERSGGRGPKGMGIC